MDVVKRFFEALALVGGAEYSCDANESQILDDCKAHGKSVTLRNVRDAFVRTEPQLGKYSRTALTTAEAGILADRAVQKAEELERDSLIMEIIGDFETFVDGRGRTVCMGIDGHLVVYKDEVARINAFALEKLREVREQQVEHQRLRAMSAGELEKVVQNNRPTFEQFLPLPPRYVPSPAVYADGQIILTEGWSLGLLKRLPSKEVRRLLRLYGAEQINDAIKASQEK